MNFNLPEADLWPDWLFLVQLPVCSSTTRSRRIAGRGIASESVQFSIGKRMTSCCSSVSESQMALGIAFTSRLLSAYHRRT